VLGAEPKLQPLGPLAAAVVLYALCHLTHANPYLAAFAAGITAATVAPNAAHAFEDLAEPATPTPEAGRDATTHRDDQT
jgi:hypothetical protein